MSDISQWNDDWNTNIEWVDKDHKKLFQIYKILQEACECDFGSSVIGSIVDELISYAATHFANEEKMLEEQGYADLEAHKKIHQDLQNSAREFKERLTASDREQLAHELGGFIQTWLIQHILDEDFKYVKALK